MNLLSFLYFILRTRLNSLSGVFLIVCFGILAPIESVHAQLSQVDLESSKTGLEGASSTAVSPDGQHVYVTAPGDNAVTVFTRNATTGQLSFVQALFDGVGGVDGLNGAESVTVSPDGQHVYVAASGDSSVAVFTRDAATGQLSFVQALFDDTGGVDGLGGAVSVTVSPDGQHVYVAAVGDWAVAVFTRNPATGQLSFVQALVDGVGGVNGLGGADSVTVSPDGQHVYVAAFVDAAVAVFTRDPATGQLSFVQALFDGVGGVDGLGGANSVTVSPDGQHVYVAAFGDNAVAVFTRNPATGQLSFVQALVDGVGGVDGLGGAFSVTVSPDGQHVYVAAFDNSAVVVFTRNPATGQLSLVQALFDDAGSLDGAASVTVSPDGQHVYVAAAGDDAVAVLTRDPATGQWSLVQVLFDGVGGVDGLLGAKSVTVSPDGQHVYVAGSDDAAVAVFTRDPATGQLSLVQVLRNGVGGVEGLAGAQSVTVSPDGQHVYVASFEILSAVVVFTRNAATGQLSFVQALFDGRQAEGLFGAKSVTVSPDGQNVYVAAFSDDAVVVFTRNPVTGQLRSVQVAREEGDGIDGLDGAFSVTVSPDGQHVYVAARDDSAVAVFTRNAATGQLSLVQALFDGVGGVDGLAGARSVTVSPDGQRVYVAAADDNAVAVFTRDPATGQLSLVQALFDGVGGVEGLAGAVSVTASPDSQHVYVAASEDDALVAFTTQAVSTPTTTTITSDGPDPSTVGQAVTVTFTVTAATGTPSGTVTVSAGADSCTGTVAEGSCQLTFTSAGNQTLVASYAGEGSFAPSVSAGAQHTVNVAPGTPGATTTTITSASPDPSTVGQAVTVAFTVTAATGTPSGTVTVSAGADSCTGTVAEGSCQLTFTSAGNQTLVASYAGEGGFLSSVSASESHTVTAAPVTPVATLTTITSASPDPSTVGQAVTVAFTVTADTGTPTGTVTVSAGADSCTATVAQGSCQLTFTSAGNQTLVASYAGEGGFLPSVSAGEAHTVTEVPAVPIPTLDRWALLLLALLLLGVAAGVDLPARRLRS